MATKRMLSSKIVDSDAFLDMPQTSQLLYFHLAMRTDDDGFVGNPKKIMRMIGSAENDLSVLFTKKFILGFESGVIVIKHHRINNNWDSYNCKRTQYTEEFKQLNLKENGAYTLDNTKGLLAQTEIRLKSDEIKSLEENRIEETRREENRIEKDETSSSEEIPILIKAFEVINPASKKFYGNTTQRKACSDLIESYTFDRVLSVIEKTLPKTNGLQFFPTITTPLQLFEKWSTLEIAIKKYQGEKITNKNKYQVI